MPVHVLSYSPTLLIFHLALNEPELMLMSFTPAPSLHVISPVKHTHGLFLWF